MRLCSLGDLRGGTLHRAVGSLTMGKGEMFFRSGAPGGRRAWTKAPKTGTQATTGSDLRLGALKKGPWNRDGLPKRGKEIEVNG